MYSTREISLDAMRKPAGNKGKHTEGQRTETSDSTQECNWVVGSEILTLMQYSSSLYMKGVMAQPWLVWDPVCP